MRNQKELTEFTNTAGQNKVGYSVGKLIVLGAMAGMYIAFGAVLFTTVSAYGGNSGTMKILGGVSFSLGLILVVFAGAELFTGNSLLVISLLNKKIKFKALLRNWFYVYFGNLLGSLLIVVLMYFSKQYLQDSSIIGLRAIKIANTKVTLGFDTLFVRGILCNALVCLAVWMTMVCKNTFGKVISIIFPITAFVAIGFEHSVANMYFIPIGIMIKKFSPTIFWQQIGMTSHSFSNLDINSFLITNLIPVTLGNVVGGVVLIGMSYWYINREKA